MHKPSAAIGTATFLIGVPGVIAGLGPWLLTHWHTHHSGSAPWLPVRVAGMAVIAIGVAVLLPAFVRFVSEGSGTPAPIAPTQRLVVGGMYRYVRNPMYVAVTAIVVGQAGLLAEPALLAYAALFVAAVTAFVVVYEEPTLRRQFGDAYVEYCRNVPRWLPRRTPWHAESAEATLSDGL